VPTLSQIARALCGKRRQPFRAVFVVAALPLFLFAVAGAEYGAFALYAALGALCLLQAALPTLAGWGIIVLVYSLGGGMYLYLLIGASLNALRGRPTGLWDGDAVLPAAITSAFCLLAIFLWFARPVKLSPLAAPALPVGRS
jgi:hypothetical protein